jgi:ribonuclease E
MPASGEPLAEGETQAAAVPVEEPQEEFVAEAEAKPRPKRRRGGRKVATEAEVEPDSSPMVERPVAQEPPVAEVEAPEQPFEEPTPVAADADAPRARRRPRARKEAAASASAPAEKAWEPAKPARKRRSKAASEPEPAPAEPAPAACKPTATPKSVPTPDNDPALADGDQGERRSGWWQRTFG